MFSERSFRGTDGLEKSELADLLSHTQDVTKAAEDVARENAKKKHRNKTKDIKRATDKHDEALSRLKECVDEWRERGSGPAKVNTIITTRKGLPLRQDTQARQAMRKLYSHLRKRQNPLIAHEDASWDERLSSLTQQVRDLLTTNASGDLPVGLWVPTTVEELPFKGESLFVIIHCLTFSL
jgi:hypothetical protein